MSVRENSTRTRSKDNDTSEDNQHVNGDASTTIETSDKILKPI